MLVDGVPQNAFGGFVRLRALRHRRDRAHRGGARAAERALWRWRDRRDRPHRHPARRTAAGSAARSRAAECYGTGVRPPLPAAGMRGAWGLSFDGLTLTDGDTRLLAIGSPRRQRRLRTRDNRGSLGWSDRSRTARSRGRAIGSHRARISGSVRVGPGGPLRRHRSDLTRRHAFTSVAALGILSDRAPHPPRALTWSDAESDSESPFGQFEDQTDRVTGRYQADTRLGRLDLSAGWEFAEGKC